MNTDPLWPEDHPGPEAPFCAQFVRNRPYNRSCTGFPPILHSVA